MRRVFEQAGERTPVAVPVTSASEWSVCVGHVTEATRIRRAFRDYLVRYATPESDVAAAELIFGELLGNVVRYAAGPACFRLTWSGPRPTLLVSDRGPGFDTTSNGSIIDGTAERGRGLSLVRAFATDVVIRNRASGGASVSVTLPVERNERQSS